MSTTTTNAFNDLLKAFITELQSCFPEQRGLLLCLAAFDSVVASSPTKPLEMYMEAIGPHSALLMARDPSLFAQPIELAGNVDLSAIWAQEDVTDATRDALWQYLSTLYILGTTIQSVPADVLSSIEKVAGECATQMETTGRMDMNAMTSMLMSKMSEMMGGSGGDAALGAALSSLGSKGRPALRGRK
jgi:hypothetical protein